MSHKQKTIKQKEILKKNKVAFIRQYLKLKQLFTNHHTKLTFFLKSEFTLVKSLNVKLHQNSLPMNRILKNILLLIWKSHLDNLSMCRINIFIIFKPEDSDDVNKVDEIQPEPEKPKDTANRTLNADEIALLSEPEKAEYYLRRHQEIKEVRYKIFSSCNKFCLNVINKGRKSVTSTRGYKLSKRSHKTALEALKQLIIYKIASASAVSLSKNNRNCSKENNENVLSQSISQKFKILSQYIQISQYSYKHYNKFLSIYPSYEIKDTLSMVIIKFIKERKRKRGNEAGAAAFLGTPKASGAGSPTTHKKPKQSTTTTPKNGGQNNLAPPTQNMNTPPAQGQIVAGISPSTQQGQTPPPQQQAAASNAAGQPQQLLPTNSNDTASQQQKKTKQEERKAERDELYRKPFKKSYKQACKDGLTVKIGSIKPNFAMQTEDFITLEIQLTDMADILFDENEDADIDLGDNNLVWYEAKNQETFDFLIEHVPKVIAGDKAEAYKIVTKSSTEYRYFTAFISKNFWKKREILEKRFWRWNKDLRMVNDSGVERKSHCRIVKGGINPIMEINKWLVFKVSFFIKKWTILSVISYGGNQVFKKLNTSLAKILYDVENSIVQYNKKSRTITSYFTKAIFLKCTLSSYLLLKNCYPLFKVIFEMEERLVKPLVLDRKVGREGKFKLSGGTFVQLQRGGMEDLIRQKRAHERGEGASNN